MCEEEKETFSTVSRWETAGIVSENWSRPACRGAGQVVRAAVIEVR